MKTILIVDDDYMARNKIRSMVEWEQYGDTIVWEAANGREALEKMQMCMPQIVLVDMDMPIMNGVELIREIIRRKYPVSVIVLSSYNDFAYVRESMKLGALDYILKGELNAEQLWKTLLAVDNAKENEQNENLTLQDREYLRALYTRRILLHFFELEEECRQWIVDYRLPLGEKRNILALCEIDDYFLITKEMDERGQYRIQQFIEQLFRETTEKTAGIMAVKIRDNQYCMVLSCDRIYSIFEAQQMLNTLLIEIRRNLKRFLNMTITASISSIAFSLQELSEYYKKAEQRLRSKFYLGGGHTIWEQALLTEFSSSEEKGDVPDASYKDQILELLLENDREGVEEKITGLFCQIRKRKEQEKKVRDFFSEILQQIAHLAEQKKLDLHSLNAHNERFRKVQRLETLEEFERWLREICMDFCDLGTVREEHKKYNKLTANAIAYLHQNYKHPISLSETAEYLQVSGSHLSRVFKSDTGMNLVSYLNHIRIEKAKQMLETKEGIPLKEVAFETGFKNYNHFFSTFKQIVGMIPNEYREKKIL